MGIIVCISVDRKPQRVFFFDNDIQSHTQREKHKHLYHLCHSKVSFIKKNSAVLLINIHKSRHFCGYSLSDATTVNLTTNKL